MKVSVTAYVQLSKFDIKYQYFTSTYFYFIFDARQDTIRANESNTQTHSHTYRETDKPPARDEFPQIFLKKTTINGLRRHVVFVDRRVEKRNID